MKVVRSVVGSDMAESPPLAGGYTCVHKIAIVRLFPYHTLRSLCMGPAGRTESLYKFFLSASLGVQPTVIEPSVTAAAP